jgi:hypothetical protein
MRQAPFEQASGAFYDGTAAGRIPLIIKEYD